MFDLVKSRVSIYDVLSNYLKLKKKGSDYLACCPFHNEKTASFTINTKKDYFYCFGCQVGGDIFSFVEKYHNISNKEAIDKIAQQFNIILPTSQYSNKYKDYFNILLKTAEYYFESLNLDSINYLENRSINSHLRKVFMIGFSEPLKSLINRYALSSFIDAGLVKKSGYDDSFYDFFRNRITFPIMNKKGDVLGFGARIIDESTRGGKYINSAENHLFKKREVFYGEFQAWDKIAEVEKVYIVEGYLDCIRMHQYGYINSLATLGTAFTIEHAKSISNIKEVCFCFDSDEAGLRAIKKCLDIICEIIQPGNVVTFIKLPKGYDPDSFLLKYGKKGFDDLVRHSYIDIIFEVIGNNTMDLGMMHHELLNYQNKIINPSVKYAFGVRVKALLWQFNLKNKNNINSMSLDKGGLGLRFKPYHEDIFNSRFISSQFEVSKDVKVDIAANKNLKVDNNSSGMERLSFSCTALFVKYYDELLQRNFFSSVESTLVKNIIFSNADLDNIKNLLCTETSEDNHVLGVIKERYKSMYNALYKYYDEQIPSNSIDIVIYNLKIYIIRCCIMFYMDKYSREDGVSNHLIVCIRDLHIKLKKLEDTKGV